MKKLLVTLLLTSLITLKGIDASAQTYEDGYATGYAFAMEKLKLAADAHPEWGLVMIQQSSVIMGVTIITYSGAYNDYQQNMLASSSVNTDYGGFVLSMKDVNVGWNGYYWGFQQACADFVIGA